MAQRLFPIHPPPGSVIQAYAGGGGPPGSTVPVYYLSYDHDRAGEILNWLRDLVTNMEDTLQREAAQKVTLPPVLNVEFKPGHDWGEGGYKIGKTCSRCKQLATGFEKTCVDGGT